MEVNTVFSEVNSFNHKGAGFYRELLLLTFTKCVSTTAHKVMLEIDTLNRTAQAKVFSERELRWHDLYTMHIGLMATRSDRSEEAIRKDRDILLERAAAILA